MNMFPSAKKLTLSKKTVRGTNCICSVIQTVTTETTGGLKSLGNLFPHLWEVEIVVYVLCIVQS